ncbi:helix-turn-helix protein [Oceanihabitans sediminis]|uniref:Helix-turn-helix domain-containing protein n=1 Tax=Oceanihabitans sediminis TaxID=1812012 RepID=A0A368P4Q4_9FLAO|nr:helix-turn-helix transcriptional regulator [Oceanihabitans sediminis]RBP33036.1 helix-turn-helix protein [Oceanihabitans sediminis]RCU57448.1 helix-turn-helix domain-containing protein [Oceanihabitans sediminis]
MINNEAFAKRLQKIIEYYGESASSFSEKVGVQRSTISHILSGRNKPSLDFVMKVLSQFPEVDLYWLMNGKGSFPSESKKVEKPVSVEKKEISTNKEKIEIPTSISNSSNGKKIERIVIFYSDGSFQNFENS